MQTVVLLKQSAHYLSMCNKAGHKSWAQRHGKSGEVAIRDRTQPVGMLVALLRAFAAV